MSVLEIIGVISTLAGICFAARGKIIAWPLQILASIIYTWLFFSARLFGEMLLQGIYVILAFYGWWVWTTGRQRNKTFAVTRLTRRQWIGLNTAGIILTLAIARFQVHFLPTDVPYLDSFIFVFGLLAQWMQAGKKIENWPYWIILDITAAGIYWHKDLALTAGLYLVLAMLALHGWIKWQRDYQHP